MEIVDTVTINEWEEVEKRWIADFKKDGCRLTNYHTGGSGGNTGCKASVKTIKKLRDSHLGKKHTEETKRKISETLKLRPVTWGKRISEAKMGHTVSEEARRKIGDSHKGKKQSEETIRKRIAPLIGRKRTPEQIETLRIAAKLRCQSEEYKKGLRDRMIALWAKRKAMGEKYLGRKNRLKASEK